MAIPVFHPSQHSLLICIDTYQNSIPTGTLYHPSLPTGKQFSSLSQLLLSMEHVLDTSHISRSLTRRFSLFQPLTLWSGTPLAGAQATFLVQVLFQQNASWQGSVTWLEGQREEHFRSVLELIRLFDSALCNETMPSTDGPPPGDLP